MNIMARTHRLGVLLAGLLVGLLLWHHSPRLSGQTPQRLSVAVGARAAMGYSRISFRPHQNTQWQMGFESGLSLRVSRHEYVALLLELNYLRTAYRTYEYTLRNYMTADSSRWQGGQQIKGANSWINMPLLMQLHYHYSFLTLQMAAGGVIDFMLTDYVALGSQLERQPIFHGSTHQRLGIGAAAGAAIGARTRVGTFLLEYRFLYRFTNVYHRARIPRATEPTSNLINHSVGLAYYFPLGASSQKGGNRKEERVNH